MTATNITEVRELAMKHLDMLLACGYIQPPMKMSFEDRVVLVQSITLHSVILECKGEIDQFAEGLKYFNIINTIRKDPYLLKQFLCLRTVTLTPGNCCVDCRCTCMVVMIE